MLKPFLLFFKHPLSLFLYGINLSEYQTKKCTLILRSYPERETLVGFDVVSHIKVHLSYGIIGIIIAIQLRHSRTSS